MVTKVINLDLKDPHVIPVIYVTKFDSGLRAFEFHLYDGPSEYVIPAGVVVTFQGTKPDGKGFMYGCTTENNIVNVNCTEQMTAVIGDVKCSVVLVDSEENRIASFLVRLVVLPSGLDDSSIISDSDLDYINKVLTIIQANGALVFIKYEDETIFTKTVNHAV